MRTAVLSDIHGNLDALQAVMRDVARQDPDRLVVLGDTVNYGAHPRECLDLVTREADIVLVGNHEEELATPHPDGLAHDSRLLADWTALTLAGLPAWEALRARIVAEGAPALATVREPDVRWMHGSPRKTNVEYVWPGYRTHFLGLNPQLDRNLTELLGALDAPHGFCGHTHVPSVLVPYSAHDVFDPTQDWNRELTFVGPTALFYVPRGQRRIEGLAAHKAIVNPGSVGQPRDGDPLASWALYDGDSVEFRRVPYAVSAAQAKIRALPVDADARAFFADRLSLGE
jgi:diadenosine tetraphosphatase ApaH/serine/threonine PP2A family protein phosphatase